MVDSQDWTKVVLAKTWTLGKIIAKGGFGAVYEASGPHHEPVVAKLIGKTPATDRELLFVDLAGMPNIIPVIDSGEYEDHFVIVMPRARHSLRDTRAQITDPMPVEDTLPILRDVATALQATESRGVVHRDLKPENILFYNGDWCLSDFGIARLVALETSTHTWKRAMTYPYAAPEQWQGERATPATDVYALGVIAYELLSGRRPFEGDTESDFREQHLHGTAPPLTAIQDWLANLITECMLKPPGSRPKPESILRRLEPPASPPSPADIRLQGLNRQALEVRAQEEAVANQRQSAREQNAALFEAASNLLAPIVEGLLERILTNASQSQVSDQHSPWVVRFNDAELYVGPIERVHEAEIPFTVIATSQIRLQTQRPSSGYRGRSHSLWYCDAQEKDAFRWYETAFMRSPLVGRSSSVNPFALAPNESGAQVSLSRAMGTVQLAWPFTPFDQDGREEFIEQWIGWFVDAAQGNLRSPSLMPERNPDNSWRR